MLSEEAGRKTGLLSYSPLAGAERLVEEMTPPAMGRESTDWKSAVLDLAERIEGDYQEKVGRFAKGINVWGNSTTVGFDVALGRGRSGPMWGRHTRYAERRGFFGLFGPRVEIRDLADVEREFRAEIDTWLAEHERKASQAHPPTSAT